MKKLILMASLLAPAHTSANSCSGNDHIAVRYFIYNTSAYGISLGFDESRYGENPDRNVIKLAPGQGNIEAHGCSDDLLTGYETRATLRAHVGKAVFDLAYLYIDAPHSGAGVFSYEAHKVKSPECHCHVHVKEASLWSKSDIYDCSSYYGPMKARVEIHIRCK